MSNDKTLAAPVTDEELQSAYGIFNLSGQLVDAQILRLVLEQFAAGRVAASPAPVGQSQPKPISRAEWIAQAKAFYIESGDNETTARECAKYLCNQQDWAGDEVGDPRYEAQEDVQGRGRTGIVALTHAKSTSQAAAPAQPAEMADREAEQLTQPLTWRPMETAPTDGTMVRLLVDYSGDDAFGELEEDTSKPLQTIGTNCDSNHPDEPTGWLMAGWNWTHDCFTQGNGKPIGWLPF